MKHNLLRNFLALVLSGIMLAGVGCKNYDDDIDKINNRLDELYVTVADLDEQIESVRNAIPSLDALNEEVAALRSELDGVKTDVASIDQKLEAIGDVQAKLNELSQELKDYVNGAIQSSEETLRNELATKGAVSELEALIEGIQEDYKAELEEINNKLTALEGTVGELPAVDFSGDIQELKDRLTALEGSAADADALAALVERVEALEGIEVLTETDVNNLIDTQIKELLESEPWLGDSLNEAIAAYLSNNGYITNAALNDYATYNETLAKLIDEMENEQSDYAAALIAFIQANQTQIDANELQILVDGNQKKMSELMNEFSDRLFALENRIQSLVYVPSSLSETSNLIPVTPAPYIDFGKDGKEYLGNQTLEMTFRVSPASLVEKMTTETVSIITRKVSTSSTGTPTFTVESVTASEQNEGEFTVKATTAYKFGSDNDETLAIALNVKIAGVTTGSEDEQTTHTGIDYTTSFLGLKYTGNGACINDALRIVKVDGEGKLVAGLSNGLYSSSLKYNDYSVVNFLEGFDVYYFDGKKYMSLSEMWGDVLVSSRSAFDKRATINSANENNKKSYKVTAKSVQIDEANLPTPDTDLIGDVITSSKVTFTVALDKKSLEIGEAQHKVTVVSNGVETSVPATAIAWNHTKALNKSYTGEPVYLKSNVSVEHYNEMKVPAHIHSATSIEMFNGFVTANEWIVYVADNAGNIVKGASVKLLMDSSPTADTDVQRVTPTFNGMTFAETGSYTAYAKYVHSDKTTTTITIPVTASGAPEISYEISKEVMYVGTSTYTVVEGFAEKLWKDAYKEAFGSKEDFLAVVAAMSAATGDNEATLAVAGNDITVTFPAEYEFKTYRSTLTLSDKSGLEIVFPAEIKLNEAHAMLTPNPLFVTNGRVNAIAEFNADGSRYDVVAQPLGNAYTYQVGEGEQALPGVKVVYEINKELQGDKLDEMAENGQTVPEIDVDNKLIWNDWDALELKVDAYLVFTNSNEEVKGSRVTFTVAIDSPYADDKITVATKGNEFELSQDASFKVAQLLTLNSTYQSGDPAANTNVFDASTEDGLHANLAKALGGEVKYETTFSNVNFAFDEETGVITYTGEDSSLKPVSQTIEVKVTYTNNFGVEFAPVTVQIKTK